MDTISNIRTIAGNKAIDFLESSTQSYLILLYHSFPKSYFLGEAYLASGDRAKATVTDLSVRQVASRLTAQKSNKADWTNHSVHLSAWDMPQSKLCTQHHHSPGTIFLDPDIITASDPTTYQSIENAGRGDRLMFDRRVNDWVHLNAFLFHASFSDGLDIEIQVNPEFGDQNTALAEALRYAPVIGRLPTSLRADVETVWIHRGDEPFGGGNNNILIHTDRADQSSASGILEETLVHEAAHTSLDADHATAPEWFAAQTADGEFISTFARDHPIREDVAESFLVYLALRHRSERISQSLVETISQTIPNRVAYFDSQEFDMNPIVVPDGKGPSPLLIAGSADFVNDGTEFQGNVYNGFEINSRAATFSSEAGTITRISFLDPAGDLMFAEFGSDDPSTILTISLENYLAAVPSPYNQPATTYAQGLPTFTIENATPLTFFSTFTLGNDTSRIDVALINSQTFSGDVNGIADIRLIRVDSKGGETTKIGGINAASANFIASEGIIGIDALDVIVEMFLFIG